MKRKITVVLAVFISIGPIAVKEISAADGNDLKSVVSGNTDFAFALYGKLKDDSNAPSSKSNLFFSPYSISTALSMTYGGARGQTKEQMAKTLHFNLADQNLHSAFVSLQKQIVNDDNKRGYQLFLVNSLWGQKGYPILKEFLDSTCNYYGATFNLLDFARETEKSRKTINSWVKEKTKNKIKDIIPSGGIDEETVLVLANAVYFKGEWKFEFNVSETKNENFIVSSDDKVKASMMHIKENFNYYEDANLQMIKLPYKGDEISMLVILPNKIDGLNEIESRFTSDTFNALLLKMQECKVDVSFPKFKIIWGTFSLKSTLKDLGMPDAFEPRKADFSGIDISKRIWISNIFHKTFIEVDEKGTEASAATSVVLTQSSNLAIVFRADHPFIFIIRDNHSGSILFMGRVMNPAE